MASLHVNDVVERKANKPALMPTPNETFDSPSTGFPSHKRRMRVSKFKQNQQLAKANGGVLPDETPTPSDTTAVSKKVSFGQEPPKEKSFEETERERINRENQRRIASMSEQEIAEARKEMLEGLNPQMLHKLMMRADLDEKFGPSPFDESVGSVTQAGAAGMREKELEVEVKKEEMRWPPAPSIEVEHVMKTKDPHAGHAHGHETKKPLAKDLDPSKPFDEDLPPVNPPDDLVSMADLPVKPHFPTPQSRDLDPNDPDFLETLRQKYFPETPADPSKLAWMAPLPTEGSIADRESPYHPGQSTISTAALRFDFRGKLLPPSLSREIPVSKGLHHHGLAPEAAGYTIEELAIYARSAVPAQRCIAYQTLGRILYRLGHGDWGTSIEDDIAMGIWHAVKEGRVIESLTDAVTKTSGHRGSQAYATEALWLFEKGGWKEKTRGR